MTEQRRDCPTEKLSPRSLRHQMRYSVGPFLAGFVIACCSGCGDDPTPNPSCYLGDSRDCKAKSGCIGVQQCAADGTWISCKCPNASLEDLPRLGGSCSDDTECPTGGTCLLPNGTAWLGGGPPEGICVADCSSDPSGCDAFANGICVTSQRTEGKSATSALCMPTCDLSTGAAETPTCSEVASSACELLETGTSGFCRPYCRFDSDCTSAHCDRQFGVCVSKQPGNWPVAFGETCDPNQANCNGICLDLAPAANQTVAVCSNRCTFGTYDECGVPGAASQASTCAYASSFAQPGNIGYCAQLCDCNDQCLATGFVCRAFTSVGTQEALKRLGMCVPANGSESGVACIEGS